MKEKLNLLILTIVLLTVFPICVWGQMKNMDNNREFYEKTINQIISCCDCKIQMADSEHKNIRMTGELAIKKANFCRISKQQLVEEMTRINLPPKTYKVHLFVNSKFYELYGDRVPTGRQNRY
ncbi:MAG: hypothetical protein PVI27_06925 [Desulfobacteraceae bacterium]|jgi:hypothetical protein